MTRFQGFPRKLDFTPIPNLFFSELLPQIEDCVELKVTLHIFWLIYRKKGRPRFASYNELLGDRTLMRGLGDGTAAPEPALRRALGLAVERGTLLRMLLDAAGSLEELYFPNTEEGRETVAAIQSGAIKVGSLLPHPEPEVEVAEKPNIFSLYEENIGLLTPIIAEELRDAEKEYPASWLEEAFKEAVANNKRSWRYIARILEHWAAEGKDSGKAGRHSETKTDPDKYIRGRYGRLVKR